MGAHQAKRRQDAPKRGRRDGAGYSVPAAADEIAISPKVLRKAIELGQVAVIEFAGLVRIPKREVLRLKEAFDQS